MQIKKGGCTSNNNVQANTNNIKEETPETEQREASGSDIVRPTTPYPKSNFLIRIFFTGK